MNNNSPGAVPAIDATAFDLQGYPFNRVMFNALISRLGQAIVGEMTLDQAGDELIELIVRTANGRLTAAESLGHREFVMTKLYRSA